MKYVIMQNFEWNLFQCEICYSYQTISTQFKASITFFSNYSNKNAAVRFRAHNKVASY